MESRCQDQKVRVRLLTTRTESSSEPRLRYFTLDEFRCSHCGEVRMDNKFLLKLDRLRDKCGFPFVITSGYRCADHPVEAKKEKPGMHNTGRAADIRVSNGKERYLIVSTATKMGFNGIGVNKSFVHVDTRNNRTLWEY